MKQVPTVINNRIPVVTHNIHVLIWIVKFTNQVRTIDIFVMTHKQLVTSRRPKRSRIGTALLETASQMCIVWTQIYLKRLKNNSIDRNTNLEEKERIIF